MIVRRRLPVVTLLLAALVVANKKHTTSEAWLMLPITRSASYSASFLIRSITQQHQGGLLLHSTIPDSGGSETTDGGEFDCEDEEECEIDWSTMMPPDGEEDEAFVARLEEQFVRLEEENNNNNNDSSPKQQSASASAATSSASSSSRTRLEMHWELETAREECDVYRPVTCGGSECAACHGQGVVPCRFCRGTGQLHLTTTHHHETMQSSSSSSFVACSVCQKASTGFERCRNCQGTGWIADWTGIGGGVSVGGNSNNHTLKP